MNMPLVIRSTPRERPNSRAAKHAEKIATTHGLPYEHMPQIITPLGAMRTPLSATPKYEADWSLIGSTAAHSLCQRDFRYWADRYRFTAPR
jgi:hypothetical protein